jgi:glycerol-3-phosphate dehydrogenase
VVDRLQAGFGVRARQGCQTARLPFAGAERTPEAELAGLAERHLHVERDILAHLALNYGPGASTVLALAADDTDLARRIVPGLPYLWAEVPYAVQHEMALTLSDFLIRRTHVIYEDREHGLGCATDIAAVMAPLLAWDAAEVERQLAQYRQEVTLTQVFRRSESANQRIDDAASLR